MMPQPMAPVNRFAIQVLCPGVFPCEKAQEECHYETGHPRDEEEYSCHVIAGLMELTQVPSV